jgi:hypothetical protein
MNREIPDIWEDATVKNGGPDQFDFVIQGPNYRIPANNPWILGLPRFALDR